MVTRPEDVDVGARITLDHHDPGFNLNETVEISRVRDRCPVAYNTEYGGFWMVTGYPEVAVVARDDQVFAHIYEAEPKDGIAYGGTIGVPRPETPSIGINEAEGDLHASLR